MRRRARPLLGTLVDVAVASAPAHVDADAAIDAAFAAVALTHRLMSFHEVGSDVSRLNRAPADTVVAVDPHTWQVLALAQQLCAASGGVFNIACAPRLVEWDCLPAPDLARPAWAQQTAVFALEEGGRVRKLAAGWVDLGGIAKGYAVDLAVAALRAAGVKGGCVNAGGDLRVFGPHAFPIAVRNPSAPAHAGAHLELRDEALATSACCFSAREVGGRRVSALVDGRSGEPLDTAASSSVFAPACALADALTKVVAATGDPGHPALATVGARALIM